MKKSQLCAQISAVAVVCFTLMIPAEASASSRSTQHHITYNLSYFQTNHGYLTFHSGKQIFYGSPGKMEIHVGDKINFVQDTGALADVTSMSLKSTDYDLIHVTKSTHTEINFTTVHPGIVTLDFNRGHSTKTGEFTVYILEKNETLYPILQEGHEGDMDSIKMVQQSVGSLVTGIFGTQTKTKVQAFQKAHRLVADGIVGPETWEAMDNATELDH